MPMTWRIFYLLVMRPADFLLFFARSLVRNLLLLHLYTMTEGGPGQTHRKYLTFQYRQQ
ncbi:MAG: hypothetical protein K0Q74_1632 [Gammaproteobacteria bacterium]|nr:hypothetical protein [Gammaproteobacteria bacterium]